MEDIPEDLRELKDFPVFNSMFQDGPKFRQNLTLWAFKTDKVGSTVEVLIWAGSPTTSIDPSTSIDTITKLSVGCSSSMTSCIYALRATCILCSCT